MKQARGHNVARNAYEPEYGIDPWYPGGEALDLHNPKNKPTKPLPCRKFSYWM